MVDERGLPDPSPGNDCNDVDILVRPCKIQKSDILLSTKKIAAGTGNLATEIFSGASLGGGLRVPTRESLESVFRRL